MSLRRAICLAALALGIYCLAGCLKAERAGRTVRRYSEQGESGGVPFSKAGEETTDSEETSRSGVDTQALAGAISIAVKAAMGAGTAVGLGGSIPAILGGLATTAATGLFALKKAREANQSWDAERAAAIRAAALLPPHDPEKVENK